MRVSAALRDAGQRIPIVTMDLGREAALDLASEGLVIGVGAQQPYAQGQAEARAAILALLDRSVPPWVVLPGVAVTRQNVEEAYRSSGALRFRPISARPRAEEHAGGRGAESTTVTKRLSRR